MKSGISFKKIRSDDDAVELKVDSSDGDSLFSTEVYVGHQDVNDLVVGLENFKDQIHGGIFDIELGSFGPEYAGGAFHARPHFRERGKIHITVSAQSKFEVFGIKNVAGEATLYMVSEPALLDAFIAELKALKTGLRDEARLEAA